MKIKLSSKRLRSGKCQVRFQVAEEGTGDSWYGYALAEPKETLKEVVGRIENRFMERKQRLSPYQKMLYNMGSSRTQQDRLMIFRDRK
ncbi:hypothetical protein JKA74_06645 [Marivirga sp. S37H4]|uniref:Uncharacterized protein n=1 Tax=Marivirga aurantiaca TaxID=2802615 RepID=A0A934WXB2_9BACT|nr:hypothetical protein [Marivirga aurantiaca]MBK6264709.1 hypothetical protein [Marivirga aurantiaca]